MIYSPNPWHPSCICTNVLLDRLQSGYLLFETPQGFVRAELSPRQRIYLLWTFRNFRQLSIALLNQRQRRLVIDLFHNNTGVVSPSHNPSIVIGVVEDFAPPATVPPLMPRTASSGIRPSTIASTRPIDASPAQKSSQIPVKLPVNVEIKDRPEKVLTQRAEIAPVSNPVASSLSLPLSLSLPKLSWPKLSLPKLDLPKLDLPKFDWPKLAMSKVASSRMATAAGALSLCIISVVAWQRVQVIPSSQAHDQPVVRQSLLQQNQLVRTNANALPDSPYSAKPAPAHPIVTRQVAVKSASAAPAISRMVSAPASATRETRTHAVRVRPAAPTPSVSASGPDGRIQASRPPLHFAYPDDVHARGVVALTAGLDSDGTVRSVRIVSGNRALAAAAVRAVRHWRYRPYLKDGQPVATETNIVISFFANDAISMTFPPSIPANR